MRRCLASLFVACSSWAASVTADLSAVRPGPVTVESSPGGITVQWPDERARRWRAEFSLDPAEPLLKTVGVEGRVVIERARPLYWCSTGIRRGGWDQFFDFPPSHPQGIRRYSAEFQLQDAKARTAGDRVELFFRGLRMGIFEGGIAYTFYPGSRLMQQEAVASTRQPDTAYFYDAGLRITADWDRRPGGNMHSKIAYYDTASQLQSIHSPAVSQSERIPVQAKYRTLAAQTEHGSIAVFPAPHQYFFARDFTTNMGYVWHSEWRGGVSIGVRQLPDDNSPYYPWMNAPPGTEQRMSVFYMLDDRDPKAVLEDVLRYTNGDRFPALEGFKTLAPHWHFAYTVQAMEKGLDWVPPFKPVLKDMGIDAAMIADFHGDGHPRDLTNLRLKELAAFFRACRAQSDSKFLIIPAEEANVHLGGHWIGVFPKPVYWFMDRPPGTAFRSVDPQYGAVYGVANAGEFLDMARRENGYMYQTHPRTKGSIGFPDQIRDSDYFRDPRYLGGGWKAMPSDLSSPRLGERALKLLDDMNNWGLQKRLLGEVDVFQIDSTHELYPHMNANYVRIAKLPDYDNYGRILEALSRGEYFISTGEVLAPDVRITAASPDEIAVDARLRWTFPLRLAEIVWGDGAQTFREIIALDRTRQFGSDRFHWKAAAKSWKWARWAVWDVAGNGAFGNPVWR